MEETERYSRLRLTVSGGLEVLAKHEVQTLLRVRHDNGSSSSSSSSNSDPGLTTNINVQLSWHQQGNSGSQLQVLVPQQELQDVAVRLMACRFVEYVSLEVACFDLLVENEKMLGDSDDKNNSNSSSAALLLLEKIQQTIGQIPLSTIQSSMQIWKACQETLSTKPQNLGLEDLPGELLPTPEMAIEKKDTTTLASASNNDILQESRPFLVNTIYTKAHVAKAIAESFQQLVQAELQQNNDVSEEEESNAILWLDAGAGSASLLQHFPQEHSIGIDTHPHDARVHAMDFFHVTKDWLQSLCKHQHLCIISNPPFAEGSRGDYRAIVQFLHHAMMSLEARFMGVIVPAKFARQRVWKSLGLHPQARLVSRFMLPVHSFYDPSDSSSKNIQSIFLIFDLQKQQQQENCPTKQPSSALKGDNKRSSSRAEAPQPICSEPRMHVTAKRDKGAFRNIGTKDLEGAVVSGLHQVGVSLGPEKESLIAIAAKLTTKQPSSQMMRTASLELYMSLNTRQPLALSNCMCSTILEHSLGWISTSVKPSIASAMCTMATTTIDPQSSEEFGISVPAKASNKQGTKHHCSVMVNTMIGEGTIELESQNDLLPTCFLISGDKNEIAVRETASRLESFARETGKRPLVDLVIWDAQRPPLRSGVADAVFADLPFVGGKSKKAHQVPSVGTAKDSLSSSTSTTTLDYKRCMAQAARILVPGGHALVVSADGSALSRSIGAFNGSWLEVWTSKLNLGGLTAKIFWMTRLGARSKDVALWVNDPNVDLSQAIYSIAKMACAQYFISYDLLELEESSVEKVRTGLVVKVQLIDSFCFEATGQSRHCYRIWFDILVNNNNAKILEKVIRNAIESNPPSGASL